jgi:LacI family transcriptional regulator, galactose operon repressor
MGTRGRGRSTGGSRRVTITTVAKAAEVSVATVSRVVRNHPDVKDTTRERVMQAIEELGFRPSPLARALVSGHSATLGLIVRDMASPFYPELAKVVEHEAGRQGLTVLICGTADDPEVSGNCVRRMLDQRIGAIIHASVGLDEEELVAEVGDQAPVVFVNRRPRMRDASFVVVDNRLGARRLTEHLLAQGHRRIGFIGGPAWASNAAERRAGFLDAMRDLGPGCESLVSDGDFRLDSGRARAHSLLSRDGRRPTALIGVDDLVAIGAMEAALERGLGVPEDVAIAGFDDTQFASSRLIGLTSVAPHIDQMGRAAVRTAMRLSQQGRRRPIREVIEPSLVVRRSSAAAGRRISAAAGRRSSAAPGRASG